MIMIIKVLGSYLVLIMNETFFFSRSLNSLSKADNRPNSMRVWIQILTAISSHTSGPIIGVCNNLFNIKLKCVFECVRLDEFASIF